MTENKSQKPDFFEERFLNPKNNPNEKADEFLKILNSCLSDELISRFNAYDKLLSVFENMIVGYHTKRCKKCAEKITSRENNKGGKNENL